MVMDKYTPNRARSFVRKKYTTFCTEQIVALRSVNIFLESDRQLRFAAKLDLCAASGPLSSEISLHRATPSVTRGLGFSGLIRRTNNQSPLTTHGGMWRMYSNPDPHRSEGC
jgi:hypothetical protein